MLTLDILQQYFPGAAIVSAEDPSRPAAGQLVRTSHEPVAPEIAPDHRDIYIVNVHGPGKTHAHLHTWCLTDQGPVTSWSYPNEQGLYPQFRLAAPAGPSSDAQEQDAYRTGYTDAVEFVPPRDRFSSCLPSYQVGYADGVEKRTQMRLKPQARAERIRTVEGHGLHVPFNTMRVRRNGARRGGARGV